MRLASPVTQPCWGFLCPPRSACFGLSVTFSSPCLFPLCPRSPDLGPLPFLASAFLEQAHLLHSERRTDGQTVPAAFPRLAGGSQPALLIFCFHTLCAPALFPSTPLVSSQSPCDILLPPLGDLRITENSGPRISDSRRENPSQGSGLPESWHQARAAEGMRGTRGSRAPDTRVSRRDVAPSWCLVRR